MLNGIYPIEELKKLVSQKRNVDYQQSFPKKLIEEAKEDGWQELKELKTCYKMRKSKPHDVLLEDRVWSLLYKMGFEFLSGERGAELLQNSNDPDGPKNQLDVVAIDNEVALMIECKSSEDKKKYPQFQSDLQKHVGNKKGFTLSVNKHYKSNSKRKIGTIMFLSNKLLAKNDLERAKSEKVVIFEDRDLNYYEKLVTYLGKAAKYQFLSEVFKDTVIPGLEMTVPAFRSKLGPYECYTFSIIPEYLLKISYVAHRLKGKTTESDTYQRMISKSRLANIKRFIDRDDGIFPTNIVINLKKTKKLQFNRSKQEGDSSSAKFGWLTLSPAYKSAWIIDGQHRLYAYSDHPKADTSFLNVLAFVDLPEDKQANLFIEINHEQKSVPKSLMQELFANLDWYSDDPSKQIRALNSRLIMELDEDPDSPFYQRICRAEQDKDDIRCITHYSLTTRLNASKMFVAKKKNDVIVKYGPLWDYDMDSSLQKATEVINGYFYAIVDKSHDWWKLGAEKLGGGLSMNDSVVALLRLMFSILEFLEEDKGFNAQDLSSEEIIELIEPYATTVGEYLGSLNDDERQEYRNLRGSSGQIARFRQCQEALNEKHNDYNPIEFQEHMKLLKEETNMKAGIIIRRINDALLEHFLEVLKREHGEKNDAWWFKGVPPRVRQHVDKQINDANGEKGGREENLDLIHFREIALQKGNWELFENVVAFENKGKRENQTHWIVDLNDIRQKTFHSKRELQVTMEELNRVRDYDDWVTERILEEDEKHKANT